MTMPLPPAPISEGGSAQLKLAKPKIFLIFCLGFIGGVFLGRFVNYEIMAIAAMIFIIAGCLGYPSRAAVVVAVAGLLAVLGAWRFVHAYAQNDLAALYGRQVAGQGRISEEPDVRPDKTFLTLDRVQIAGQSFNSKILLNVSRFPEYAYGDEVSFTGKLAEPADATPADNFSYKNYLSRYGVDGLIYYPQLSVIGKSGFWLKAEVLRFKQRWMQNLSRILPEPQNAFLGGLLLGAKRSIPQDLIDAFSATGTSHVIAISGYNITIIAAGIDWLLRRFLRKRISFVVSLIAIALFVLMTGASASVVRAGIMGALLLIALNLGRVYAITGALAFTAAIMLAINPQILHFDVGFQLSFAALLGLVYILPLLEKLWPRLPAVLGPYLLATLAAEIATLPILLLNFSRLSLVAPLANILVLPVVPVTMLLGFLAGILSFIYSGLALPVAWLAWALLTYIIEVVRVLAAIPFASLSVSFNVYLLAMYYIILIVILWKIRPNNS